MKWQEFVNQWSVGTLIALGIPKRTVYAWRAGTKEPSGWQMKAAKTWIVLMAGNPESPPPGNGKKR